MPPTAGQQLDAELTAIRTDQTALASRTTALEKAEAALVASDDAQDVALAGHKATLSDHEARLVKLEGGTAPIPPTPKPVASVDVSVDDSTLTVGQTARAFATPKDADGNVLTGRAVAWSSADPSVATVSPSGIVTAVGAGSASIIATCEGVTGTVGVAVAAVVPPQPPTFNWKSHEPSGMTKITERHFNALDEDGWTNMYNNNTYSIVQDPTAPVSPPNVGQMKYPKGFQSGGAPVDLNRGIPGSFRTLYWSMVFRYASDYVGDASGVNKLGFAWQGGRPTFVPSATGSGTGPLRPQIRLQDNASGNYDANVVPGATISRGIWHCWQVIVSLDGIMDSVLDGVLVGHHTGVKFSGGAWEKVQQACNFGGAGGPSMPHDTYIWWDAIYLSGK